MADKNIKIEKDKKAKLESYAPVEEEKIIWDFHLKRKAQLQKNRMNVGSLNVDVEEVWREADNLYEKAEAADDEAVEDESNLALRQAFAKVNIAQANLIDRNPVFILKSQSERYQANKLLIKGLAQNSWDRSNSLQQLKNFGHNAGRYGFAAARTYHRVIEKEVRFRTGRKDEKGKEIVDKRTITSFDEIYFQNLSPFNVWLDEQTRPGDIHSTRDWCWRELWDIDDLKKKFPITEFPNMKFVGAGGNLEKRENAQEGEGGGGNFKVGGKEVTPDKGAELGRDNRVEVFFYENQSRDWLIVEADKTMISWEMLPQNKKNLSLTYTWWNLRNDSTPYGIGIPEILKNDDKMIEKINNLTIAQIKHSIVPSGWYEGTDDLEGQTVKLKPGEFRKKTPGTKVDFVQQPTPNLAAVGNTVDRIQEKINTNTGVTKPIEGEVTGKTLGEVSIAREAGLKRLRLPLGNIKFALDIEFKNRIDLIKQVYSLPKVERLMDMDKILNYTAEVNFDRQFYFWEGEGEDSKFFIKRFREENLKLEQGKDGSFVESEQDKFFKIKPEGLIWEGDVNVKIDSILLVSEELVRMRKARLAELITKFLSYIQQSPELIKKTLNNVIKSYEEEPSDWLPPNLLEDTPMNQANIMATAGKGQDKGGQSSVFTRPSQMSPAPLSPESPTIGNELGRGLREDFKG